MQSHQTASAAPRQPAAVKAGLAPKGPGGNESLAACIALCRECRETCFDTLFNYCLEQGGRHTAAEHVRLMFDCIEFCQLSADLMSRQSEWRAASCAACADICAACADSCARMEGDGRMQACADICRRCAESCRGMAGMAA
jgi:hypothetical protein